MARPLFARLYPCGRPAVAVRVSAVCCAIFRNRMERALPQSACDVVHSRVRQHVEARQ